MMPVTDTNHELEELEAALDGMVELDPAAVADPAADLAERLTAALDALEEEPEG
jgi:hypothetical protein